jgi:N-acetylneuraminic acid mutarotase
VLVAGGGGGRSAELYDPLTGHWTVTGNLSTQRYYHTASVLPDGKVLVTGGTKPDGILKSSELYDPSTGNWTHTSNMNYARYQHVSVGLSDGKVLVLGGMGGDVTLGILSTSELYDPSTGHWIGPSYLMCPRYDFAAAQLNNGRALAIGGLADDEGGLCEGSEVYDESTDFWNVDSSLQTARHAHTATALKDGNVLVVGGYSPYCEATAELYQ